MSVPEILSREPDGDDHEILTIRMPVRDITAGSAVSQPTITPAAADMVVFGPNLAGWVAGPPLEDPADVHRAVADEVEAAVGDFERLPPDVAERMTALIDRLRTEREL